MKRFFRRTYYAAVIALFLLIALAGLTQTRTFRSYLRSTVITELNANLNGTISFGDIKGNLVTGIEIPDIALEREGRTVIAAERIEARYNLISMLFGRISIARLTINRPHIFIWRDAEGRWNLDGLVLPTQTDSGSSGTTMTVHLIEVLEGRLQFTDSTDLEPPADPRAIHYSDITLDLFSLRGGVRVTPKALSVTIHSLGFESSRPPFRLEELSGEFSYDPQATTVRNLKLRTGNSRLSLSASLHGADIFSLGNIADLEHARVWLDLSADRIDVAEFKQFLPGPVDFLDRSVALDVRAEGTFADLSVRTVALKTPRTYLTLRGTLGNLHHPSDLVLHMRADDNIINPMDLPELLPGLGLPDLTPFGILNCSFTFDGEPEKFKAWISGSLEAGQFEARGDLDFRRTVPVYACTLATSNLDLARILDDPAFASRLNTKATIVGSGTTLDAMTSLLRVQADSSSFSGLPVSNSILVADIADRNLRTSLLLQAGPTRIDVNARTRFAAQDSLLYSIEGTVNSLDLATILKEPRFLSDLSFNLHARGDLVHGQSDITLDFLRSSLGTHRFENHHVRLALEGDDSLGRVLTLQSDPLDLRVDGLFAPVSAAMILEHAGSMLVEAVSHRLETLDSLRGRSLIPRKQSVARHDVLQDSISARVSAEIRDLFPLGVLIDEPLFGSAVIAASVEGTASDLSTAGSLTLHNVSFAGSTAINFTDATLTFSLDRIRGFDTFRFLESDITLNADRVLVDSTLVTGLSFRHHLHQDSSTYALEAVLDSVLGVSLAGSSVFVPNRIDLTIPQFRLWIADHLFESPDTLRMQFGRDGLKFEKFLVQHEAEEVALEGLLDPGGISDLRFSVQNFLLNNLREFSRSPEYVEKVRGYNGVLNGEGVFSGNLERPEFRVSLNAQGVTIGETVFGQIRGEGGYRNSTLQVFLEFRSRPHEPSISPELSVSGTMPLRLGKDELQPGRSMDLTLHSRGFRLEFLDPFVPVTRGLKGALSGDIVMRGTLDSPLYEGSLAIADAEFLFLPLGLRYRLQGNLVPDGRTIRLVDLRLMNLPEDRVPALIDGLGSMMMSGSLTLEGLDVRAFDIRANGQLLVMKETARLPDIPFYGNIYIATGSNPLRWHGEPERSFVTGDILVKNASMTFPPSRDVFLERSHLLTVEFVDDTSSTIGAMETAGRSLALAGNGAGPVARPGPAMAGNGRREADATFLDKIAYNLTIETAGLTQVRFVFNQLTNEELFADLKGRLVFLKDETDARVSGELEVGQRSYYRYFKSLSASGKLLFTGDLSNPELSIVATYEGTYRPPDTTAAEQRVVVRLDITGTRDEPKVKMGLDLFDLDGNKLPARPDPQSDAIAFLVSGTFKDNMTQGQQRNLVTTSLLGSIGSSLLSGPLTELVRNQVGYITSIDVYYYGGGDRSFGQAADIRLTGEIGDAVIRLGGRVFEDIGNTNVSIQFPMSSITGSEAWRNLILEIERRSGTFDRFEQRPPSNGVHLLYRITF